MATIRMVKNYYRKVHEKYRSILQHIKLNHNDVTPSWESFYDQFELHFRGSYETISNRLKERYTELLLESKKQFTSEDKHLLDLGCGHGEFLDLSKKYGYITHGVDASKKVVESNRGKGHHLVCGDILRALKKYPRNSFSFISLLHVIEHCDASYILNVFSEVNRCLTKDGIFLVETPSLYSLWVSSRQFYLDPTHIKPVHPEYIRFMGEYNGLEFVNEIEHDSVKHRLAADLQLLSKQLSESAKSEFVKMHKFLYGPMDVSILFKKN